MSKSKLIHILVGTSACYGGWIAHSTYEKMKSSINSFCNGSLTVFAAKPLATTDTEVMLSNQLPELPTTETKPIPASRTGQIMRFGFPSMDQLRALDDYVLSYDRKNRTAYWVFEHFTREDLKKKDTVDRAKCAFYEDLSIHQFFRSTNEDYKGSGFDRGHLAAAGNHRKCQQHCDQTFLLSNMAPQVGKGFNRDAWNKLEKYARHMTRIYKNVYVCTGPLYLPRKEADGKTYVKYQVIGPNHVAVPTHFFKIIVGETEKHELEMESYVMPNAVIDENASLFSFQVPVESVERAAGFLFFDKIPKNQFKRINGRKLTFT